MRGTPLAIGVSIVATSLAAQPAQLVKDIAPGLVGPSSGEVSLLANTGGGVFFRACAGGGIDHCEPWVTDGTAAGTRLVRTGAGVLNEGFVGGASATWFLAFDRSGTTQVWKSDGTAAGTVPVPFTGVPAGPLFPFGSGVLFNTSFPRALWKTDGTPGGATQLTSRRARELAGAGAVVVFAGTDGTRTDLWATDGTPGGTGILKDIYPASPTGSQPTGLTRSGAHLFFAAADASGIQLWTTDGTSAGTIPLTSIGGGCGSGFAPFPPIAAASGGAAFFACGNDLWTSDGTPLGTKLVAPGVVRDQKIIALGATVLFMGYDDVHGFEPWKSDGTLAGTGILKDIETGVFSSSFAPALSVGPLVFFTAWHGGLSGLWRTDGTEAGTVPVYETANGFDPSSFSSIGSNLLFELGGNLWTSDGTNGGTKPVKTFETPAGTFPAGADSSIFSTLDGLLFFEGPFPQQSFGPPPLYGSDGTEAGTSVLLDWWFRTPLALHGHVLFMVPSYGIGPSIWTTDGTATGTFSVKTFANVSNGPSGFTEAGGLAYFVADDGADGPELWRTNGTTGGTFMVKDIWPGVIGSGIVAPAAVGNLLYFGASNGTGNSGLWRTDGTNAGTSFVKDVGTISRIVPAGARNLFLVGCPPSGLCALWTSDGTTGGTVPLAPAARTSELLWANGALFFVGYDAAAGFELWKSDGTPGGTALVKDILPGVNSSNAQGLTSAFGRVFFAADDGVHGAELWSTDGSSGGTQLFKDIDPGPTSSSPRRFKLVAGSLLFAAGTAGEGLELWSSDGTPAGTALLQDIAPGPASSDPSGFFVAGDRVFFVADDGRAGPELWQLPIASLPAVGSSFHPLAPCRAVDTRVADGGLGGVPIAAGQSRTFALTSRCGVPPTARALAANVTVTGGDGAGSLTIFSASRAKPGASVLAFGAGQTRAGQAILELRDPAPTSVVCATPAGTGTHLVIDVIGYFE